MMRFSGARGSRRNRRVAAAGTGVVALAVQLLVVVGLHTGAAAASPGSLDPTFGFGGTTVTPGDSGATGVTVLASPSPAAGDIAVSAGGPNFEVILYDTNGNPLWSATPFPGAAKAVTTMPNGNIVAVGYKNVSGACSQTPAIAEYTTSGSQVFATAQTCGGSNQVLNAVTSDGSEIVAAGNSLNGGLQTLVEWINAVSGTVSVTKTTLLQSGGTSLVIGPSPTFDALVGGSNPGRTAANIVALNKASGVDTSFGSSGVATVSGADVTGMTLLPSGNLIAVAPDSASASTSTVTVLDPSGLYVDSFGASGSATSVAYQPFGDVLTVGGISGSGQSQQMFLEQYDASARTPDGRFGSGGIATFAPGGPSTIAGLATQVDGKVVAVGGEPFGTAGNTATGLIRVFGPALQIQSPGILQVATTSTVTVNFAVTTDEPLFADANATFCAPGQMVNGTAGCGSVTVPAGTQSITVPVTINVTGLNQNTSVTLSAQSSGGFAPSVTSGSATVTIQPIPPYGGYRLVASDGGVFTYGSSYWGSHGGSPLNKPVVGMASTLSGNGYYLVGSDGGIFNYGGAVFYGSHGGSPLNKPIVGMAVDPATGGYWLVASDGGIFNYNAPYFGSHGGSPLNQPIVGMASTPDGGGYWLVAADGGIFNYGDAAFLGSHGGSPLNKPIVGMAANPIAQGYWLVASDGGIFNYGNAPFQGSHGGSPLNKPIVGMGATPSGQGYWLVASDGGIFTYNAPFYGSHGGSPLNQPVVGMSR